MSKRHRFVICNPELCIGCKACEKACIKSAYARGRLNKMRLHVLALDTGKMPNQCRQCDDSPCANVCPTSALRFSEKSYIEFRENICIGCKLCTIACPYGAIHMEAEDMPSIKNDDGDYKVGCTKGRKSVALKCDLCEGRDGVQACIDSCPKGALVLIDPQTENHVFGKKLKGDQTRFIANILGREYVEPIKEELKVDVTSVEPKSEKPSSELKESVKVETPVATPASETKDEISTKEIKATQTLASAAEIKTKAKAETKEIKKVETTKEIESAKSEDLKRKDVKVEAKSDVKAPAEPKNKKGKASHNKGKGA